MSVRTAAARSRFHTVTGGKLRGFRTLGSAFFRLARVEEFSYPAAFLLTELVIMLPIISYYFIGELVGDSEIVGGDYFTFAAVGVSITVMLQAALSGFGTALQQSQNRGQFELILAGPANWVFLPISMNLWRMLVGVFNGFVILTAAAVLGEGFRVEGMPSFLLLVFLGVGASMAIGVLAASVMIVAKRAQPLLRLYGLAAGLLGGALFSIDQLPSWLVWVSYLIPHTYVINAGRTVLMQDPGTFTIPMSTAVVVLVIFNLVVFNLGMWLFSRALQFARREGILGGY